MLKKAMIFLGLGPDEEYAVHDEYAPVATEARIGEPVDQRGRVPMNAPPTVRPAPVADGSVAVREPTAAPDPSPVVRPMTRAYASPPGGTGTVRPLVEPEPSTDPARASAPEPEVVERKPAASSAVRTLGPASAKPHAVTPASFNEAQEIGDRFKAGQPVIVSLQTVDRDVRRRLVDFASGLCYALGGKMDRVADQVYLLTPADVEVSREETRRALD